MKAAFIIAAVTCLFACAIGFQLQPSIYGPDNAHLDVCFNRPVEDSQDPRNSASPRPYFSCANQGKLRIISCVSMPSSPETCPLNFIGSYGDNSPSKCETPKSIINGNCTVALQTLCSGQTDCIFSLHQLPQLGCFDSRSSKTYNVKAVDSKLSVEYFCQSRRGAFRPFANKRYAGKFSKNIGQPLRKLSLNRMAQL